jgi:hypothetical protein
LAFVAKSPYVSSFRRAAPLGHDLVIRYAPPRPSHPTADPIVDRLRRRPYKEIRRFLAKQVRPRYPRFLYKYRGPVDASVTHLRDILVEGRLWLSSPRDFNDPFDMTAHVVFTDDTPALRQRFKDLIDKKGREEGLNWKERKRRLDQFMARPREEWAAAMKRIHEENMRSTGVFSFAGDPRHILMWSHYAKDHSGICIQFESARAPATLLEAVPVRYVDDYPVYDWVKDDDLLGSLLHKFRSWEYEREWRIVWPDGAHTYLEMDPGGVTGLIFGSRASENTMKNVRRLLDERQALAAGPPIRTYVARKHPRRYALTIHRIALT